MNESNEVLDIIISLTKMWQLIEKDKAAFDAMGNELYSEYKFGSPHYLLGQVVRQLWSFKGQTFVSRGALDLWGKLNITNEHKSIYDTFYRDVVDFNCDSTLKLDIYKGNKSTPEKDQKICESGTSQQIVYRDVIHDEHVVPVKVILDLLFNLDLSGDKETNYKLVDEVLKKIAICKMLKGEDRRIKGKCNRSSNYQDVIDKEYKVAGIEIADKR